MNNQLCKEDFTNHVRLLGLLYSKMLSLKKRFIKLLHAFWVFEIEKIAFKINFKIA